MVHLLLKNLTNGHNKHSTTLKVINYENIKVCINQSTDNTYLILTYNKIIVYQN